MDPSLAAPIATLTGAIATAILMWASYTYPRGYHRSNAEKDADRESRPGATARTVRSRTAVPRRTRTPVSDQGGMTVTASMSVRTRTLLSSVSGWILLLSQTRNRKRMSRKRRNPDPTPSRSIRPSTLPLSRLRHL